MSALHPHDAFFEGLCSLVQQSAPQMSELEIAKCTGWPFLMVAAEEWLDSTTIIVHPAMRATQIHGLFELRSQVLSQLSYYGLRTIYLWMSSHNQLEPTDVLPDTMIVGIKFAPITFVDNFDDEHVCVRSLHGERQCIEWVNTSNGSGIEVASVLTVEQVVEPVSTMTHMRQAYRLLRDTQSVTFGTAGHPIREWQTWHFGIDSLEVIALCADTAAPLSLTADAVARTAAVYYARWRMAEQIITEWAAQYPQLAPACVYAENACFFMDIVQKYYPIDTPRRALSVAEGAVVSEAFRDARQAWRAIADLLHRVVHDSQ